MPPSGRRRSIKCRCVLISRDRVSQPAPFVGQIWGLSFLMGPGLLYGSPSLSFFTCKWGEEIYPRL